ncbi:fluoride efflux transporter FluC [Actinokineospora enzanensis]|uniref:fluoride efflux transporter FluC n=1 Tax=Actinokineospora enzanensis TaxID=155975 RepID=UPI0003620DA7|nr:CrcB family protein [Actinokineospora enzanensis]
MNVLVVALGAAVGAPLRYVIGRRLRTPWGTLVANLLGSFVLGVVIATADPQWRLLLGTGFCGALTTYSTFAYETTLLSRRRALVNIGVSVAGGIAAFWTGLVLAG